MHSKANFLVFSTSILEKSDLLEICKFHKSLLEELCSKFEKNS